MDASPGPPRNLVLIGFMGCGKSTVGRDLQQLLGYPLVDMDHEIEQQAGTSIREIFEQRGEQAFRDLETDFLRHLVAYGTSRRIISTGGGAIVREENRALLRQLGYVVWLNAPSEDILERTARHQHRPLLNGEDPAATIRRLQAERKPWYAETAHLRIDTGGLDSRELATGILESARYFFSGHA